MKDRPFRLTEGNPGGAACAAQQLAEVQEKRASKARRVAYRIRHEKRRARGEPPDPEDDSTNDDDGGATPPLDDLFDDFFCYINQDVGEIPGDIIEAEGDGGAGLEKGSGGAPPVVLESRTCGLSIPDARTGAKRSRALGGGQASGLSSRAGALGHAVSPSKPLGCAAGPP